MYLGLALAVIATLVPVVDTATLDSLSAHVRDAYPHWNAGMIEGDRNAILGYLLVTDVLGIIAWLWTTWLVAGGRRGARAVSTVAFVLGTGIALMNLTLGGERYDTIVPTLYGLLGMLPCIAGLVAVTLVWRHQPSRARR